MADPTPQEVLSEALHRWDAEAALAALAAAGYSVVPTVLLDELLSEHAHNEMRRSDSESTQHARKALADYVLWPCAKSQR